MLRALRARRASLLVQAGTDGPVSEAIRGGRIRPRLTRRATASEEIGEDARLGARDRYRANGLGVEIGRAGPADDRVGISLGGHGMERYQQERCPDPLFALPLEYAGGAEERFRRRVVAREAKEVLTALRAEARDGQAPEADLALARPALAEVLTDPGRHDVPFRRERAAQLNSGFVQSAHARGRLRKVVEADEHVPRAR